MAEGTACILLLGLPSAAFCGIDLLSFTASPRFQGIKLVPEGWHFVFVGANTAFSLRTGRWLYVQEPHGSAPQLFMFHWDASTESLEPVLDEQTQLRLRGNLGAMWREGLTPYRQTVPANKPDGQVTKEEDPAVEEDHAWEQLIDCISEQLLDRVLERSDEAKSWAMTSASSASQDADRIPGLTREESAIPVERELGFLPIDLKRTWREGAIGRERSEAAQDRTWALKELVREHCKGTPQEVIGELQLAFIMVLTLNNNSCLEQWRRILSVLLTCQAGPVEQPTFFSHFLQTLKLQLEHCSDAEAGLIDLSEEGATLLKSLLKRFRQGLEQQSGSQAKLDVTDELDELETYLREEHGWFRNEAQILRSGRVQLEDGDEVELDLKKEDEEDEDGDFAPTVVDLTPELAEQLGLPKGSTGPGQNLKAIVSKAEQAANESDEEDEQDLENIRVWKVVMPDRSREHTSWKQLPSGRLLLPFPNYDIAAIGGMIQDEPLRLPREHNLTIVSSYSHSPGPPPWITSWTIAILRASPVTYGMKKPFRSKTSPPSETQRLSIATFGAQLSVSTGDLSSLPSTWAVSPSHSSDIQRYQRTLDQDKAKVNHSDIRNLKRTASGNPFEVPLPQRVNRKFWASTHAGLHYALYSLVPMKRPDTRDLLQAIRWHTELNNSPWTHRVICAPMSDFCGSHETVRDIFEYHTSLVDGADRGFAPGKFLVIVHKDWDNQGLLLVDLDSSPWDRGKPALLRLDVSNVPAILMQLELSNANFADFKAAELATGWPDPIEGYTDTNLQTGGQDVASGGTLKKTGNHPKPFGLGVGFE